MTKIIYLFLLLTASTLAAAQSSPYFFAPDDCKSKASYSSCVEPANAIDSCDIDDDPCACSAYNIDARCLTKYCAGTQYTLDNLEIEYCSTWTKENPDHESITDTSVPPPTHTRKSPTDNNAAATGAGAQTVTATGTAATAKNTNAATRLSNGAPVGAMFGILAVAVGL